MSRLGLAWPLSHLKDFRDCHIVFWSHFLYLSRLRGIMGGIEGRFGLGSGGEGRRGRGVRREGRAGKPEDWRKRYTSLESAFESFFGYLSYFITFV